MPSMIATLKVQEGKADEARKLLTKMVEGVRKDEPGTLLYISHQRVDDPHTFVFFEKYESDAALATHGQNLAKWGPKLAGILAGRPEIIRLEEF